MNDLNYESFLCDFDELKSKYPNHIVAYADGSLVAVGKDADELLENIPDAYRNRSLFIKELSEKEAEPIVFHRPYYLLEP